MSHTISLESQKDRYIVELILNAIDRATRRSRKRFKGNYNLGGAELWFDFGVEIFDGLVNRKLVTPIRIKEYLGFLQSEEIVFPAGYYGRGKIMLLDSFDYRKGLKTTSLFINPGALSNALRYIKHHPKYHILKTKRITFNLFTGKVLIRRDDRVLCSTVKPDHANYLLLKKIIEKKRHCLTMSEIRAIGGTTSAKRKVHGLRAVLHAARALDHQGGKPNAKKKIEGADFSTASVALNYINGKEGYYRLIEK